MYWEMGKGAQNDKEFLDIALRLKQTGQFQIILHYPDK